MNKLVFGRLIDVNSGEEHYEWVPENGPVHCVESSLEEVWCAFDDPTDVNSENGWSHFFYFIDQGSRLWRLGIMGTDPEVPFLRNLRGRKINEIKAIVRGISYPDSVVLFFKSIGADTIVVKLDLNTVFYLEEMVDDTHA